MRSLRLRIALWFGLSLFAAIEIFVMVTHHHLENELRETQWEEFGEGHAEWQVHGNHSESEINDIIRELWTTAFIYAIPTLAVCLGVGYLLAWRAFAPILDMSHQLGRITARNLGQRVSFAKYDDEFRAIELAVNALLARLETTFGQLTEYSARVAHELRTPLTLLRLQVEDASGRIEPGLAESLQDELGRLSDYVEQCLLLATAEQGRLTSKAERVDLRPLLTDVLDVFILLARSQNRAVVLNADEDLPSVMVDPRNLRQMLHNLLTNAIQHGQGDIGLTVTKLPDGVVCRIDNQRLSAQTDTPGIGLGLRIVRAIAAVESVAFTAEQRSESSFCAELRFHNLAQDLRATDLGLG